jgi:hypothetical protein
VLYDFYPRVALRGSTLGNFILRRIIEAARRG